MDRHNLPEATLILLAPLLLSWVVGVTVHSPYRRVIELIVLPVLLL